MTDYPSLSQPFVGGQPRADLRPPEGSELLLLVLLMGLGALALLTSLGRKNYLGSDGEIHTSDTEVGRLGALAMRFSHKRNPSMASSSRSSFEI